MKYQIIPALIASNQKELDKLLDKYKKLSGYLQVDVMDGKFVKNKSNFFNFKLPKTHKYEAHLLVDNPEEWTKKNYKQFDVLIANFEKVKEPMQLIRFVKNKKKKIGFALNPETSIMHVEPYLKDLDRVLILTVHPGKYGAKFVSRTLDKINMLRRKYNKDIEVDGHIDPMTIKLCKKMGANLFAVGHYLKDSKDVNKAMNELKKALR